MQAPLVRGLGEVIRGFPRPGPGRPGDPGWFGPGSLAWRVNAETVLLLGGGRALLMQVAHPLVAAGVADHSDFTREPFERLWRTVDTALTVVFGDSERAAAAVERVTEIHRRVRGSRGGVPYSALDPELLLWVHATLVDSSIAAYERFVGPLGPLELERYYLEMRRMGTAFGIPEDLHPPTYRDFVGYLERAIAGLRIGEESRRVAREVLSPPAPLVLLPLGLVSGLLSVGLLPARIRRGLGLRWGPGAARAFEVTSAAVRRAVPLLPDRVRRWPHAREAERRVAAGRAP
ncbi:MAG TPA: oxygenase MpaB family protein [Actinomycetota bacterium]|nr:oxygenase MpaB family protein [Actinomycetota bacterium]